MNKMLEKLKGKVRSIATGNGESQTVLPFLKIYKSVNSKIQMPTTEVPYIYLVLDGEMRLHGFPYVWRKCKRNIYRY